VRKELAETADYLRETGRIMRKAIERLIQHEESLSRRQSVVNIHGGRAASTRRSPRRP
jgi:hypothetical protein